MAPYYYNKVMAYLGTTPEMNKRYDVGGGSSVVFTDAPAHPVDSGALHQHIALAFLASGMDPDNDEEIARFSKAVKELTPRSIRSAIRLLTGAKATDALAAAKAALKK